MFDDDEPVPAETFMTQEQRPAYFDNMELAQQELEIEQEITEGTGNVNYGLLPRPKGMDTGDDQNQPNYDASWQCELGALGLKAYVLTLYS
uniref:Uncharacterized protein n=1 Tax=Cryptococcus bacillisporus CA1280 TaxID=1296109 RepID=A0A0D0VJK0_CRYGA|nr:hypothetical protein I312_05615 [Cryptococcus bacillisporus CA1280]